MKKPRQGDLFKPSPPVERAGPSRPIRAMQAQREAVMLHQRAIASGATHEPVTPSHEYPTQLTRLPLFPPSRRKKPKSRDGVQGPVWEPLESAWSGRGQVLKSGPQLSVYDEDTLIGMLQLRSSAFHGPPSAMPLQTLADPVPPPESNAAAAPHGAPAPVPEGTCCHVSVFSLIELEEQVRGNKPKRGFGNRDLALRAESIERLCAVLLRFTVQLYDVNEIGQGPYALFRLRSLSQPRGNDVYYYVQWEPILSKQLEGYRTFLDLAVRRQLSPLGKAMHRFLASQASDRNSDGAGAYQIHFHVMLEAIGATGRQSLLKHYALQQLDRMVELGFLTSGTIVPGRYVGTFDLRVTYPTAAQRIAADLARLSRRTALPSRR